MIPYGYTTKIYYTILYTVYYNLPIFQVLVDLLLLALLPSATGAPLYASSAATFAARLELPPPQAPQRPAAQLVPVTWRMTRDNGGWLEFSVKNGVFFRNNEVFLGKKMCFFRNN